jgi:hypothetical protein
MQNLRSAHNQQDNKRSENQTQQQLRYLLVKKPQDDSISGLVGADAPKLHLPQEELGG